MATVTKKKPNQKIDEILSKPYKIILHDDSYNTFDWVITCLMNICGHHFEQAEQSAYIVHYRGECDVKYGDYEKLSVMKDKLQNAGLSATLESN